MNQKIIELEEKLAHFEHTIDSLNKTIFRQNQQIDELGIMLKHFAEKVQQLSDKQSSIDTVINEPPPHY